MVWQLPGFSFELTIIQPLGSTELASVGSQLLDRIELSDIFLLKLFPILNWLGWLTRSLCKQAI